MSAGGFARFSKAPPKPSNGASGGNEIKILQGLSIESSDAPASGFAMEEEQWGASSGGFGVSGGDEWLDDGFDQTNEVCAGISLRTSF
jgi:hypothetical protein